MVANQQVQKQASSATRLSPAIHRKVKVEAARRGITVMRLVEEAIDEYLDPLHVEDRTHPNHAGEMAA